MTCMVGRAKIVRGEMGSSHMCNELIIYSAKRQKKCMRLMRRGLGENVKNDGKTCKCQNFFVPLQSVFFITDGVTA